MSTLRTLKKLILGETWLLPLGVAATVLFSALVVRPLTPESWSDLGGFVILVGVLSVLAGSVARGARRR